jgi:cytoskeletal protein CcmA (bactofilin family)
MAAPPSDGSQGWDKWGPVATPAPIIFREARPLDPVLICVMMHSREGRKMFGKGGKGPGAPGAGGGNFSYIGAEMTITGDIVTESELHLDGKVIGDVSCGSLSQGEGGEVRGNIVVREARLAGLVDGAVEAGILTLEASARVTGDILYESLSVAAGAEVEGRFKRRRAAADGSTAARAEKSAPAPTPLFGGEAQAAE